MIHDLDRDYCDGRMLRAYTQEGREIVGAVWVDTAKGIVRRYVFGRNAHGHEVILRGETAIVPGVVVR